MLYEQFVSCFYHYRWATHVDIAVFEIRVVADDGIGNKAGFTGPVILIARLGEHWRIAEIRVLPQPLCR